MRYDPRTADFPCFAAARAAFANGHGSPRRFLEACFERVSLREPSVRAFTHLDLASARAEADASSRRWGANRPLSPIDGMPVAIKDCFDVRGMPTEVNSRFFAGNIARLDAAHVYALRRGGAVIVGKSVTTELTMAEPGPTLNPWDLRRTPGGSSSGSAAAVAAGMVPLGTGSQVRGSVVRPASICGVVAMKPTYGALNRNGGFDPSPSLNHLGLLSGTLIDLWEAAHQIASVAGGDPGHAPFAGGATLPPPRRPDRLARQYTAGWPKTDDRSKAAFEAFLARLSEHGVEIIDSAAQPEFTAYEEATARTPEFFFDLMLWEARWPLRAMRDADPRSLSETALGYIEKSETLTVEDFRRASGRREELRRLHRAFAGGVDGFVTLSHIGPGQLGHPKVGTPWYNDASSAIGAPAFSLPLLAIDDAPLGVQLMGFEGADERLAATVRWILEAFSSPTVGAA